MGVSGSGKTTIGKKLAESLHIPFYDADDYHPAKNVRKMKSQQPLNDQDRQPWLQEIGRMLSKQTEAVWACSALKKAYRQIIDPHAQYTWVFLEGTYDQLYDRMKKRTDHFMPPELLRSQLETLESPTEALTISIQHSPEEIVQTILQHLK